MTSRNGETLFGKCKFCTLGGYCSRRAIFSRVEPDGEGGEKTFYFCGINNEKCVLPILANRLEEIEKIAYEAASRPSEEQRFIG